LKNYIESGIAIDAALSYDLLVAIFSPGAPLHDGAVIVQKDRITAAACFLPLTGKSKSSAKTWARVIVPQLE
jgi:diadenylate cyclase